MTNMQSMHIGNCFSNAGCYKCMDTRRVKIFGSPSSWTLHPYSTSQICYSPTHCPYYIDGAVLCHLLGREKTYPFEINDRLIRLLKYWWLDGPLKNVVLRHCSYAIGYEVEPHLIPNMIILRLHCFHNWIDILEVVVGDQWQPFC